MADVTKEIVLKVSANDATGPALESLEDKLKAATERMVELAAAGHQNAEEFKLLQKQAEEYKKTIESTNKSVDAFANEGSKALAGLTGAAQIFSAGLAIANGAVALFAGENENLEKAMLKVQGSIALLNGVQKISNLLTAKSVITTEAAAAAQKLYAFAVGTSTGAMRAFRIAMLATGIGAVVALVATLGIALSKLKTAQDRAAESAKKQANAEEDLKRALERVDKQVELAVLRAKNAGKSEAEIAKIEADGYNKRAKQNEDFVAKTMARLEQTTREKIAAEVRAANPIEGETAMARYQLKQQQNRAVDLALTQKAVNERIKIELKGNKELNDKLTQAQHDSQIFREKAIAAVQPKPITVAEKKESPEVIRIRREIEIMQAKGAEEAQLHQKRLQKIDAEIKATKKKEEKAELQHKRQVEIETENKRLAEEKQKLEAEGFDKTVAGLQYSIQLLQAKGATEAKIYDATIQAIAKEREAAEKLTDEKVKALKLDELAKAQAIAVATEEKRVIDLQKDITQQINELKQSAAQEETNRAIEAKKLTEDAITAETFAFTQRKSLLEAERTQRLEALKLQFGDAANFKELEKALNDEYRQKELTAEQEFEEKKRQLKIQERDTTLKFANEAFTGVLGFIAATQGESEADARRAFNLNKAAGIADATVNTYLGASQVLQDKSLPTIAKAFAVAGIIASGLTQVRKIAATQFKASGGGGGGTGPSGNIVPSGGGQTPAPPVFSNPNVTDLSGFAGGQPQQNQPMRAYVVERDIQQTTSRVRRLSEFATLG